MTMQASIGAFISRLVPEQKLQENACEICGLVTGMTVRPQGRLLLDCLLDQPCPAELLCELEAALEKHLPAREVIICQRFGQRLSDESSSRYAATLSPWLLRHLWHQDAMLASMLRQADFQADQFQVKVLLHEECCSLFDKPHLSILEELFSQHVTGHTVFTLAPAEGNLADYTRQMNEGHHTRANRAYAASTAENGAGKQTAPQEQHQKGRGGKWPPEKPAGMIWGKVRPELSRSSIASLNSESGLVLVEGEVFSLESREVSNGTRVLIKFSLTDYDHSISCILFVRPEHRPSLEEQLKDAWVRVAAEIAFDSQYAKDLQAKVIGIQLAERLPGRQDDAAEKRVELHAHTKMSSKDALCDADLLIRLAASFGHEAVAITDHGVVQAFPEAAEAQASLKKKGKDIKVIFGMEGYLVDDGPTVAWLPGEAELEDGFVAVDVETTGLDPANDRLIEIAAVLFKPDGQGGFTPADSLVTLVNPGQPVPPRSQELTGITTDMLRTAPPPLAAIERLKEIVGKRLVIAHNAFFDLSFIRYEGFRTAREQDPRVKFNPPLVDTLALARIMLPGLANHKLNTVAASLEIGMDQHHRAGSDAETCGRIFAALYARSGVHSLADLNALAGRISDGAVLDHRRAVHHVILLAKDSLGLYNLYRLVSASHIQYFHTRPRLPRSLLQYYQAGLIVGSACESGEIFQAVLDIYRACGNVLEKAAARLREPNLVRLARLYDFLEIQPAGNNAFYLRDPASGLRDEEDLKNINRLIVQFGEQLKKTVCATGDVHFLEQRDAEYRRILLMDSGYEDAQDQPDLYFRTTGEMLAEFAYLGSEKAKRVVIDGPHAVAAMVAGQLRPFPEGSFPPVITEAGEEIRQLTWSAAKAQYGQNGVLPEIIRQRIERELQSIMDNGFAVMYYIAHKLVRKSNDDGYIVGSRGSVGSSLVASFCGITEVNPLPPHYLCPQCHFVEFAAFGSYSSGYDLPARLCSTCQTRLIGEGQDIPFETFLGFSGEKQPDIDLNFSSEYQGQAHKFIEEMFGSSHTFRAGTISAYAEKNAQAIVANYFKSKEQFATQAEISRLSRSLIGVKRTTGQHPGGIVVVPKDREIFDFTPVQYPADKTAAGTITTHFDFNAMHDTILKLDILGHDDPTMLKMLGDLTGVDVRGIPIPDAKVMSLFYSTEALGIKEGFAASGSATLGIPELGTFMAREMIRETRPARFFDLVQLMGLSHGTDVWKGNAQELIRKGISTLEKVIGCRDSIMTELIYKGLPPKSAFDIMEQVRKGRGLDSGQEALMREKGVPSWYIESCKKIRYMFPKAHAVAYTISSLRIAWFKVYRPIEYYCAYFTVRADEFDSQLMCQPPDQIRRSREKMHAAFRDATDREQKIYYILEIIEEMQQRGLDFLPVNLYQSASSQFLKADSGHIRPPLKAIPSISAAMAESIVQSRKNGPFKTRDELMRRTGLGQAAVEALAVAGCLEDLPESAQMDLFELMDGI
jgi:DNA polymerase III subunit alpha, Gram-positive type